MGGGVLVVALTGRQSRNGAGRARLDLLYDLYGALLTENQRRIFRLRHRLDLSLAEIAHHQRVSRQAVVDVLHRGERVLADAERKLGLARRYLRQRRLVEQARACAQRMRARPELGGDGELARALEELEALLLRLERVL